MSDKQSNDRNRTEPEYEVPADQAEGERDRNTATKVGRTPGQAEGERDPAKTDLDRKPYRKQS